MSAHKSRLTGRAPVGAVMFGILALLANPMSVHAQGTSVQQKQAVHRYDIAPASLADALRTIERIGGRRIDIEDGVTVGRRSAAVTGEFTPIDAVKAALAGSGLAVREEQGALWVATLEKIDRVLVVAKRDQAELGFKADRSDTATRGGTSLMDVPASVTIITSKVLETQQALSVRDVIGNVSGVGITQSPQGTTTFTVRGFDNPSQTVNGVQDNSASLTNVFGVERIEVLKGPQAILAGAGSLGGGVNIVTKKPQADPIRTVFMQYGNVADITLGGDIAGAISDDKKLTYRLIASKARSGTTEMGFNGRRDDYVLPQVRWKDARTDLIVGVSYGKQHAPVPRYTFADNSGHIFPLPKVRQGAPEDGFDTEQKRAFYQLEQRLTDNITFVSRMQRSLTDLLLHVRTPFVLMPNGTAVFGESSQLQNDDVTSGDHYLRIGAQTGPVSHRISVGVNHSQRAYTQSEWQGNGISMVKIYPAGANYDFKPLEQTDAKRSAVLSQDHRNDGMYVQDLMTWGDWNLLLNARRTRYDKESNSVFYPRLTTAHEAQTQWASSPGAGLIYSVNPQTSVYASWSKGFSPVAAQQCGGGAVPPQETRNRELGVKFDLLDSKLSLTTSAFELLEQNDLVYNTIGSCYDLTNGQITKGIEVDLQGQISPGWNAILNYTFATYKDINEQARIFIGSPKHKFSVWTTYEFQNESWKGWGVGFGVSGQSETNGSYNPSVPLKFGSQAQVDASVFYGTKKWNVTAGVKNIADRNIYGITSGPSFVPVTGRNYMLTARYNFD